MLSLVAQRPYGEDGTFFQLKGDAGVIGFDQLAAGQVDTSGTGCHPAGTVFGVRGVFRIFPASDADFAQIIHAGPDEISQNPLFGLCLFPEAVGVVAERLCAKDEAVRIFFQVVVIAEDAVVVARKVHLCIRASGLDVAAVEGRADLHGLVAQQTGEIVVELAAHGLFLFSSALQLFFRFFVAVDAEAQRAEEVEEDIHAAGHGAGGIQMMQILGQLAGQHDAARLGRLADLVAGGVQDHAGVVVVLGHHGVQVFFPPRGKVVHIVVDGLVDVPAVHEFVHHQHSQPVTGIQQRFAAGVVGRADGVVARLLEQPDLALHGVVPTGRAQNAVVVVDAGAAQDDPLAVEQQALVCAPCDRPDAEGRLVFILASAICAAVVHGADVGLRRLTAPRLDIGQRHADDSLAGSIRVQRFLHAGKLEFQMARCGGFYRNFHNGRVQRKGADAGPVHLQMVPGRDVQPDRAVNARAGVPAAVGLIRIARDDF